ncbi:hypothetical protein E2C01_072986 [Portunus trituberculatus]|uniref:Uncharacterized protein n=1 Tax=Portunus trituberculatus TaxID=210409 RepID=A0A5B7I9D6_PORTR|nr:hypothetical protein [Portunus trituberculatus]
MIPRFQGVTPKMRLVGDMGPNMPTTINNIACATNGWKPNKQPVPTSLKGPRRLTTPITIQRGIMSMEEAVMHHPTASAHRGYKYLVGPLYSRGLDIWLRNPMMI